WQRVDRPTDSRLPAPPLEPLASPREPVANTRGGLVGEGRGEREGESGGWADEGEGAESGAGAAGEASRASTETDLPPSPFCKLHPHGTDDACRPCGNARRRHQHWQELRAV